MTKPPNRPNPGDLVHIIAQFHSDPHRPKHALIIREYSPQINPGYEVLLEGKKRYFPPHLIRIVSRGASTK
tara:strand:+ start:526 stop:738 length:213 start_codon:yes stop_codon:yes gene_type:complete